MEGQTSGNARLSIGLASVAGFAAGGLVGYLVARKRGQLELDSRVNEEVQAVRDHYAARAERDNTGRTHKRQAAMGGNDDDSLIRASRQATPGFVGARRPPGSMGRLLPRIETPGLGIGDSGNPAGGLPDPGEEDDETGTADGGDPLAGLPGTGTQEDDPSPWPAAEDDDSQLPAVDESAATLPIMLITRSEFYDKTETANEKLTITLYSGDGILVDDKDVPIRNASVVVGGDYIDAFGDPSDPDIVYVRNNRLGIDFEIVRDERGYAEVILNYGKPK